MLDDYLFDFPKKTSNVFVSFITLWDTIYELIYLKHIIPNHYQDTSLLKLFNSKKSKGTELIGINRFLIFVKSC